LKVGYGEECGTLACMTEKNTNVELWKRIGEEQSITIGEATHVVVNSVMHK